ncbi:MAG: molybdopterin molybdotransferase MoeA [Spirochaetales bacterium]|jgi:molybdopterin molybdotransferase|nr:molybdopterin molybdotransferase MoeA [Spirochaetales bacterium]
MVSGIERIPLEQALDLALAPVTPLKETLSLPLFQAVGYCAAEDAFAPMDNPPFDRSPLDGFALRSEDTRQASEAHPVSLAIAGTSAAGRPANRGALPGEAFRIMTGAMIPGGCDCVVRKEVAQEKDNRVFISEPLSRHENYSFRGGDICRGQLLIQQGERLSYVHLGLLSSMGIGEIRVFQPPRIGLLCTGDELTLPGEPLKPGGIYDSHQALLGGRLRELGFPLTCLPPVGDEVSPAVQEIKNSMDALDVLITTGGVSVGERDMIPEAHEALGAKQLFRGMNFKPGMSVLYSLYRDKPLISLSGNPFAALTTFELLVKPVLAKLSRRGDLETRRSRARLLTPFPKESGGKRRFIRGRLDNDGVRLPEGHSSAQLFSLRGCNCLVDIPLGSGALPEGSPVDIVLL